jgi:hypothetical protein
METWTRGLATIGTIAMTGAVALVGLAGAGLSSGCDLVKDVLDGVQLPTGAVNRVDLVRSPSANQLLAWQCAELFGQSFCTGLGFQAPPSADDLQFSFDLVFDLANPNPDLPIPLVELLMGFVVLKEQNLGAVCVSFCDPDDEACEPAQDAQGACETDGTTDVQGAGDIIPTVDDLVGLATDVVNGAAGDGDNGDWRVIPGGGDTEAHIQFDLGVDVMLNLADELLGQAVDDVIEQRPVSIDLPYTADGTLFFEAPQLDRYALGFGPWDDTWIIE